MRHVSISQIYLGLLLATLLYMLPWAGFGLLLRPDFILLVLLYWLIRAPHLCNIGTAWMMGMLVDLAEGGLFGQHAIAYIVAAFLAVVYQRRVTLFNRWQQAGYVLALLLIAQTVLLILKLFSGGELPGWAYYLSSISGILLWQLVIYSRIKVTGDKELG